MMSVTTKKAKDKEAPPVTFDQNLDKLRALVEKLENSGAPLDESLKLFEEGIALSRVLLAQLAEAEGKVEQLVADMGRIPFLRGEE
jgi:exodeoxyribonuclease VII small subunit